MSVKAIDLANFIGKQATVQVDTTHDSSDEDFREVSGKILAAGPTGLVVQTKTGSQIIKAEHLLDVEEIVRATSRRLTRRWIREAALTDSRQHLVDRHGMPMSIAQLLTDAEALEMHEKANHEDKGHSHGEKPRQRRGRPRRLTEEPVSDVDEDDECDPDILECDSCGYLRHVHGEGKEMKPIALGGYHCPDCFDPDGN